MVSRCAPSRRLDITLVDLLTIINIGGAIFPIIFLRLQPRIGFPWTVRTIGFIMIACSAIALPVLLLNQRGPRPTSPRRFIDWSAFRELPFDFFAVANILIFLAYYIPLFYGPTFATSVLSVSRDTAFYQLAALNAASLFGRLGSSALTPRFGAPNFLLFSVLASMIMIFGWIGVTSSAGWWVWSVVYGFFSGMLISANPVVVAQPVLSKDSSVMGTRMGMIWFLAAVGVLVSAPIGGALLGSATGSQTSTPYLKLRALDGAVMAGGTLTLLVPLIAIRRYKPPS